MKKSVLVVYGTRPEAIKMAPLVRELESSNALRLTVAVTGQHREMLDQVNEVFGVEPDVDLNVMTPGASLAELTAKMMLASDDLFGQIQPDVVVVQGDTTSAFVCGLSAFYHQVPMVHLEAGLRTHTLQNPFPEEANRRLISCLADLHLAPTATSKANLVNEGVADGSVVITGNTVIDALQYALEAEPDFTDVSLNRLGEDGRRLVLVTTHRRESWGGPMVESMNAVADVAMKNDDVDFLLPMHRNSAVREILVPILGDLPNVHLTEPLAYLEFAHILNRSHLVLTDSGGIQEEAPSLGKPVLVMRDTTERPEALEAGTVRLVGTARDRIVDSVQRLLGDRPEYDRMANAVNPYGDGQAAPRARAAIEELLGAGHRLADFRPD